MNAETPPRPGQVQTVREAIRIIGQRIAAPDFCEEIASLLSVGANAEIIVKVNRRPEHGYRVTVKSKATDLYRQHLCFTRLQK
jgi:hypothetical protein